ncbi:dnaJ homolog subfamily C member 16 [Lepeophtheirus salmonis]|nr:dnaJ homolog subfamily C member 16-like [Lepeophtheirus salmonis]
MRFIIFCILIFSILEIQGKFEPYSILGVHRKASMPEIRKAYKSMAKTWHPDKSSDPEAEKRFVEITQAYELLSDPDRRRQYDNYGVTEDTPNFRKKHDYSTYERFEPFDAFNYFFDGRAFRFGFGGGGSNEGSHQSFHKVSITSKAYYSTVLPASNKQPYLILFYSDWCFTCSRIEPIWRRLIEELEPVGFGVAAVHTEHEKDLARKIGAKELPHLIMLMEGKVIHYRDPQFSAVKSIEFIRRKFPYKMVETIDDYNVDVFLNGWKDNRVRVLLFGKVDAIRLRYLTTAYKYRNRALLGYVKMGNPSTKEVVKRFGVSSAADALLLFHENVETPTASFTMKELPLNTIQEIIDAHQFLQLPRLSSQGIYDQLCPPTVSRQRLFCVILFTRDSSEYELHQDALREFAGSFKSDRVRFAYVFMERQTEFVKAMEHANSNKEGEVQSPILEDNVVIVTWRKDPHKVRYEHLNKRWEYSSSGESNPSADELQRTLKRLLLASPGNDGILLPYDAEIKELMDEHAVSLFVRIANRMIETIETIRENITKDELLPALSIVVTIGFLIIASYVISYLVKMEEESVQRQLGAKGLKVDKKGKVVPELKIHELRAETYNGMVRLLKPGCRTIVLIVDRESKEKLVPKFYKMAWPYRRNKTLMFGFIYIEKGLPWFKKILNLTLPDPRDININPKNCIGTVMSLNGHRRYFCMYHAKHPEGSRKKVYQANNGSAGAFMGFDSDLDDSSENETDLESGNPPKKGPSHLLDSPDHLPIFEDQLLDGLQMWLDRLFEGSTYRYHINYWPEFPISPASFSSR